MFKVKKISKVVIFGLCFSMFVATVYAQTTPSIPASSISIPESQNVIGIVLAGVSLIIVFIFIVYAGYRIAKKWSQTETD